MYTAITHPRNTRGFSRERILAQAHMQSLAARCRAAITATGDDNSKTIRIDAPTGLSEREIGALYLHTPGYSISYHRGWRPWKAYLLLERCQPSVNHAWYTHDPLPLHNGVVDEAVEGNANDEMPALQLFSIIEHIAVALCVVAYFALLSRTITALISAHYPLSPSGAGIVAMSCAFSFTALAVASAAYQFSIGTKQKIWEGSLALGVGLLVPPATYWFDSWSQFLLISF